MILFAAVGASQDGPQGSRQVLMENLDPLGPKQWFTYKCEFQELFWELTK